MEMDPVALRLWGVEVRWYALSYVFGALFVYWYLGKIGKFLPDKKEILESLVSWMIAGIVVGGRAFYVLFYNPSFYLQFPIEIFKVWNGGMSFHGGLVGSLIATIIVCKKNKLELPPILDLCACSAPLGLFLGRIANLINGELYGKITSSCLGVVFTKSNETLPRHPTQVYESVLEGLLPVILMNILFRYTEIRKYPGVLSCVFCLWYSTVRFSIEFLREPDIQLGTLWHNWLTMGMALSVPMAFISAILAVRIIRNRNTNSANDNICS
ncbi:MAG: prolipoprotein diacylglyceryl transferase [Aaplasma endosymbiont of Hyalomma asiaticum]